MKDILNDIERWRLAGKPVAVARVIGVEGSGPRDPGATLVVNSDNEVAGSVSGGCVEGAVVSEAMQVLQSSTPRVVSYGIADEDAFAVGLTCGGTIRILIEPLDWLPIYEVLRDALHEEEAVCLVSVVEGAPLGTKLIVGEELEAIGSLGDLGLDEVVTRDALGQLESGVTGTRHYGQHGEARQDAVSVFIESFGRRPRMIIFGAVDFTAALASIAKVMGYHVTVCDARPAFATLRRFPSAEQVVVDWPDRYLQDVGPELGPLDAVCVLTHDHKFDVPAITAALATRVGYIGAMGSRRTTEQREQRLRQAGVSEAELQRVAAPIGLDIGARTPEETAISICGEIIAARTGHVVAALGHRSGPIHLAHRRGGAKLVPEEPAAVSDARSLD
jgi:xanthine dehydrogenase accessory factor